MLPVCYGGGVRAIAFRAAGWHALGRIAPNARTLEMRAVLSEDFTILMDAVMSTHSADAATNRAKNEEANRKLTSIRPSFIVKDLQRGFAITDADGYVLVFYQLRNT